jgi:hypothetical protein
MSMQKRESTLRKDSLADRARLELLRRGIWVNDSVTPPLPSSVTSSTGQTIKIPAANGDAAPAKSAGS